MVKEANRRGADRPNKQKQTKGLALFLLLLLLIIVCTSDQYLRSEANLANGSGDSKNSRPEYEVKAAFIYNFIRFTKWPESAFETAKSAWRIGIVGRNPFGSILAKTVRGRTVARRKISVHYFQKPNDKVIVSCHVLFISESEKTRLPRILKAVEGKHVLTVSDMKNFREAGGLVKLFIKNSKVRFEINFVVAEKSKMKISSKLLDMAENKMDRRRSGNSENR